MKISTALKLTAVCVLASIAPACAFADEFTVNVTVSIHTDIFSKIDLIPSTVEVLYPSKAQITMVDRNGNPRVGRNISLYVRTGNPADVTISQPSLTDVGGKSQGSVYASKPGVYEICAKDITEQIVVEIEKCQNLYVVTTPPPIMLEEGQYTIGKENTVGWTPGGSLKYQYYVEMSTNSDFSTISANSGWINDTSYTFTELQNGQMYFYRVKARNEYGSESGWSNSVYSVQSVNGPLIVLEKISISDDVYTSKWGENSVISLRYRITDSAGVDSVKLSCVGQDRQKRGCGASISNDGEIFIGTIKVVNLEKQINGNLYPSYTFCVDAVNKKGNSSSDCTGVVNIPNESKVNTGEERITFPAVVGKLTEIPAVIRNAVKVFMEQNADLLSRKSPSEIRSLSLTTLAVNVSVALALFVSLTSSLPYFVAQIGLNFLSMLGLRKRGVPNGYVYDSFSKDPIRQAIVRVYKKDGELVWTDVTNQFGYFKTIEIEDGEYYITVSASGYLFPSKTIFGSSDAPLENIYHGEVFKPSNNLVPKFAIPLDKAKVGFWVMFKEKTIYFLKLLLHLLNLVVFLAGLVISMYAVYVNPIWTNYLILVVYIFSAVITVTPILTKREKYGYVTDEQGNKLKGVEIGLFESDFNRLVYKRVSDEQGRYRFVADKGNYYLSVLNPEYSIIDNGEISDIRVTKSSGEIIRPNIVVRRV